MRRSWGWFFFLATFTSEMCVRARALISLPPVCLWGGWVVVVVGGGQLNGTRASYTLPRLLSVYRVHIRKTLNTCRRAEHTHRKHVPVS